MTLWILWSVLVTSGLALAAAALDRAASYLGISHRAVWMGAIAVAIAFPLARALRSAPEAEATESLCSAPYRPGGQEARAASSPVETDAAVTLARFADAGRRADRWIATAWITASVILLVLFLRALIALRRERASWPTEETELGPVLVSPDIGPAVVGFRRPRIVLPSWAVTIDRDTRALLLRHEHEHVRAHDMLVLLAGEIARIALPWNAALWWMERRLRLAIELDCDARVIRAAGGTHRYGSLLLAVAARNERAPSLATALSEPGSHLETRINAMTASRPRRPRLAAMSFATLAVAVVSMVAWAPQPAPLLTQAVSPRRPIGPKPLPGNRAPRYPDSLRVARVDGHAIVSFSTDARGVPDTASVRIGESSHDLFVQSIRAVLPEWRFDSAGSVRLLFRFMTTDTEALERMGQAPPRYVNGIPAQWTVVIVTQPPG